MTPQERIEKIRKEFISEYEEALATEDPEAVAYCQPGAEQSKECKTMRELFLLARTRSWDIVAFLWAAEYKADVMRSAASAALILDFPDDGWTLDDFEDWST